MIKGIIFDVGGVLAHDVWEHLLLDKPKGLAARFDLQYDAVEKVGKALWTAFDRWRAEPEDEWPELEKEYWRRFMAAFPALHELTTEDNLVQATEDFISPINSSSTVLKVKCRV